MKNRDKPIYPIIEASEDGSSGVIDAIRVKLSQSDLNDGLYGLTKREHFAGLAMQAMIGLSTYAQDHIEEISKKSVEFADALLKELDK